MSDRITVEEWGVVSRMDTIQAAILKFRLSKIGAIIAKRRENAKYYQEKLHHQLIYAPPCRDDEFNTFHTYVIQVEKHRDDLQSHLKNLGIKTTIHYPVPIHLQPAARSLDYKKGDFPVTEKQAEIILTLPVSQFLTRQEQDIIIKETISFLDKA